MKKKYICSMAHKCEGICDHFVPHILYKECNRGCPVYKNARCIKINDSRKDGGRLPWKSTNLISANQPDRKLVGMFLAIVVQQIGQRFIA